MRPTLAPLFPLCALLAALLLAGCVASPPPGALPPAALPPDRPPEGALPADVAAFAAVAARIEPVAEAACRARRATRNCDFSIGVDDRADLPPNAFQTLDRAGRPYLVFTRALIGMADNADELAFVLGHEAAHHVAGHIPRRKDQAMTGAILAGVLAQASGLSAEEVRAAQDVGAQLGAQQYSKAFELEADRLGAQIAWDAGFDPMRGAAFFDRLPDPGDDFLGSHPPNAQRKAAVAKALRDLGA